MAPARAVDRANRIRETLVTPRLRLEPLSESHGDALYAVYSEPAVGRFLMTRPSSREDFRPILHRALLFTASHGMWAVFPRSGDPRLLGRVGFFAYSPAARPELAFLLSPSAWGRGLATEACRRALAHALVCHSWTEVVAIVRPANSAAIGVLRKLGFAVESRLVLAGQPADLYQAPRTALAERVGDAPREDLA